MSRQTSAPAATEENHPLNQLPNELLLEITEYLKYPDRFCFISTSRRLRHVLLHTMNDSSVTLTASGSKQVARRLEKDWFSREAIEEEKQGNYMMLEQLLCGHCRIKHEKLAFSSDEILHPPTERLCYGAEGWFRLCSHKSFTFKDLKRYTYFQDSQETALTCCNHKPTDAYRCELIIGGSGIFKGERSWRLLDISNSDQKRVYCRPVQDALRELAEPICPHMNTADVAVFKRLHKESVRYTPHHFSKRTYCGTLSTPDDSVIHCLHPDCDTEVVTHRGDGYMELRATRCLGYIKTALDPKWCAQVITGS